VIAYEQINVGSTYENLLQPSSEDTLKEEGCSESQFCLLTRFCVFCLDPCYVKCISHLWDCVWATGRGFAQNLVKSPSV